MRIPETILMTGTLTSGNLMDLWAQFWVFDGGRTLGPNFWHFRSKYFKQIGYDWKIKKGAREEILNKIAPACLRYARNECIEIPPVLYTPRYVEQSDEQIHAVERLYEKYRAGIKVGDITSKNVMQITADVGRILSGFTKDSETGEIIHLKDNPKMDALIEWIKDCGNEQVIVYHSFVEEGRMIEKALKKHRIFYASVRGEIKKKAEQLDRFKENKARVLVAHPKSGGEGLNIQNASVIIFYSILRLGIIKREQCEGRIIRSGQKNRCIIGDIVLRNSEDELNLQRIKSNSKLANSLLKYIQTGKF